MSREWKKGEFAVQHGMLCRFIQDSSEGIHIELVANYESGVGICCGGVAMGGGLDRFEPVTTAEHILLSRAYTALKAKEAAEREVKVQQEIFKVQSAALNALKDAQRASGLEGGAA